MTETALDQAARWLSEGRKVALATVIETSGSAPQPVESQLVIDGEENFAGSVSGGCVEGAVLNRARMTECRIECAARQEACRLWRTFDAASVSCKQ
jgi:xanthine/CO dehydrogenase XdhC/CoxF family maturation factor